MRQLLGQPEDFLTMENRDPLNRVPGLGKRIWDLDAFGGEDVVARRSRPPFRAVYLTPFSGKDQIIHTVLRVRGHVRVPERIMR